MYDKAAMYGAAAAIIVAMVTVITLVIKVWPKSLRPKVNQLNNNIDMIIAKQVELKKEISNLQITLKDEIIKTDKEMERLMIKSDKLTDLMITLSRERYPYNNK